MPGYNFIGMLDQLIRLERKARGIELAYRTSGTAQDLKSMKDAATEADDLYYEFIKKYDPGT